MKALKVVGIGILAVIITSVGFISLTIGMILELLPIPFKAFGTLCQKGLTVLEKTVKTL